MSTGTHYHLTKVQLNNFVLCFTR